VNVGQPSGAGHPNAGLAAGDTLDRYELLCPLAQGGMAAVWLARLRGKHGFQKLVAVKTIRPEHAGDQRFQRMFLDEARIAASITHPNVAQILDLGEENGVLYLVMEWIDGDSLSKLLRVVQRAGHRVPLGVALRILADACGGLHAAHELRNDSGQLINVVHRDVSPTNILLSDKGSPKVIDFGIAKAMGRLAEETSAGVLKGKISYMSPEQALGRSNVDRRADVWAAGSILHMALTGAPPFRAENEVLALHRLTSGKPPDPLPADVPPQVRAIVARTMAFNVDQRTPDCATLQAELEQAMVACSCPTTPADVGLFAAHYLGDSARSRQELVQRSIAAASDRERGGRPRMHSAGTPSGFSPVVPRDASSSGALGAGSYSGRGSASGSSSGVSSFAAASHPSMMATRLEPSFQRWNTAPAGMSAKERWIVTAAVLVTAMFVGVVGAILYTAVMRWHGSRVEPATTGPASTTSATR
jgi:serine/threonine protein kinase